MVDVILLTFAFFYIGQTAIILANKISDRKGPLWLLLFPMLLVPAYLVSRTVFLVVFLFNLIWWSRACRSSDYGFSYHYVLIIAAGLIIHPGVALFLGLIPILFAPFIRPDMQIIDVTLEAILLGIIGLGAFLVQNMTELWIMYALITLVVFHIVRAIFLFGKLSPPKVLFAILVNVGVQYYLITMYLPAILEFFAGGG